MRDSIFSGMFAGGSWAAHYYRDLVVQDGNRQAPTGGPSRVRNQLGLPGFPEVNFRPYDAGTNREGSRGLGLQGRPVSFSFVGPTGQAGPLLDIQWVCGDRAGTPNGDWLEIDLASPRTTPTTGLVSPNFARPPRLVDLYGISQVPRSGLYVVLAMTGEPGEVGGGPGGVGDGSIGTEDITIRAPLRARNLSSRFEIFRVRELVGTGRIELDPSKRIRTFFDFPKVDKPICRLVCFLQPEAARLVQIPGREVPTYCFIPPDRSLPSDLQPPFVTWTEQDPVSPIWWAGGAVQALGGDPADYGERVRIPCRRPIGAGHGYLQGEMGPAPEPVGIGRWAFYHLDGDQPVRGQVVRVSQVESQGGASIFDPATSTMVQDPGLFRLTGSFEVVETRPTGLVVCRRLTELDPTRGVPFDASEDAFWLSQPPVPGTRVLLTYTVHEPIRSLWDRAELDSDQLEQTRVSIWENQTGPLPTGTPEAIGWSPARSRRSIFDTTRVGTDLANPGSLLDLGFEPCLFPARVGTSGELEPDFDRPIPVGPVQFGPDQTGAWQVDYERGEIRLSTYPIPSPQCEVCPNPATLSTPDNPRGEVVLFGSFVVKETQSGLSLFGSADPQAGADPCGAAAGSETAAPFSERIGLPLTPQTIQIPTGPDRFDLYLDEPYSPLRIPPAGAVELIRGVGPEGDPLFGTAADPASTVRYESFRAWGTPARIRLVDCTGGGKPGDVAKIDPSSPGLAVLRRQLDRTGSSFQADYRGDLSYGSAALATQLRFPGAKLTYHQDRSVSIELPVSSEEPLWRDLLSPLILSGCGVGAPGGLTVQVGSGWALIQGRRVSVPPRLLVMPDNTTSYLYLDGTDPCRVRPQVGKQARPLPGPNDTLVARVTARAGTIVDVVGLQAPFRQINYRVDVVVGKRADLVFGSPAPHFETVAEAVRYVGELVAPEVGLSGYQVRILVTGPTTEVELPIRIPCDGILIEGVSAGRAAPGPWGVEWSDFNQPLFDLDGKSDCIFRNLALRYRNVGQGVNAEPVRFAFVNRRVGSVADRTVIENVHLDGEQLGHGLIYSNKLEGGIQNLRLVGSGAENITETGVWIERPSGCLLDACKFRNTVPSTTILKPLAGIYLGPFGDLSPGNQIRSTYLDGFEVGIRTDGARDRIQTSTVNSTLREGFLVGPLAGKSIRIDSCNGSDLYVSDPAPALRVGISIQGGQDVEISHCRIDLFRARPGDLSCLAIVDNCRVTGLTATEQTLLGRGAILSGCFVTEGIGSGPNSTVTDCLAGWVRIGPGGIIRGFRELTSGSLLAESTRVSDSVFQDLSLKGPGCSLSQCGIRSLQIDPGLGAHLESCQVALAVDLEPTGLILVGCGFEKTVRIRGDRNQIDRCGFRNEANLIVRPRTGRIEKNLIRGCRFEGPRGGIYVDSDQSRIEQNEVPSEESAFASTYSVVAMGEELTCCGNRADFGIGIGVPVDVVKAPPTTRTICTTNRVGRKLHVRSQNSLIGVNYVDGEVDLTDGYQILMGNLIVSKSVTAVEDHLNAIGNLLRDGDLVVPKTSPASFCLVGNQARSIRADGGGADPEGAPARYKGNVTGNRVGSIFTSAPDGQGRKNNTDL